MSHVAWSCDGKKLAAVGIDKIVRVWQPEKTVSSSYDPSFQRSTFIISDQMEIRAASIYSGAHADDVDHVSWNPTHPELFVSSSQKDRKIVFWDARRALPLVEVSLLF
jgi:THO complex subunit 3